MAEINFSYRNDLSGLPLQIYIKLGDNTTEWFDESPKGPREMNILLELSNDVSAFCSQLREVADTIEAKVPRKICTGAPLPLPIQL
jgi:hypothetical protein